MTVTLTILVVVLAFVMVYIWIRRDNTIVYPHKHDDLEHKAFIMYIKKKNGEK